MRNPWPQSGRVLLLALAICTALGLAQPGVKAGRTATGIAYDIRGNGPVVVLITGSNLDRRMWAREAEWLAASHTVVRYDLRAHGQSDTATAPFSHVGDLLALIDELEIEKATLLGLSAGSTIALDAALEVPARVSRLILASPSISGYVPRERPPFTADLIAALQARDYKKASEVLLATPVFAAPTDVRPLVRQMVVENERLWTMPRELMKGPASPAIDRLEQVKVPALVIVGEHDLPQKEQAEILAKRIAGARLVVVPRGGHLVNLTSPTEFDQAVRTFLQ